MVHSAYFNGRDAYKCGYELDDNPHDRGSDSWLSWRKGWLRAEELEGED